MSSSSHDAVAVVGVGAVLPDAPDAATFWSNLKGGRYSVSEVPPGRWDPAAYYDPDPSAPDKTYSKIGGWARDWEWNPLAWKMPIPPRVSDLMDLTQKWAIVAARQALEDYGYPRRPLDQERTAVILGNAMGGDMHLFSAARILYPEFAGALADGASFAALPAETRSALLEEMRTGIAGRMPVVNEDTMPGELSNIAAGRIAALWDFRGPNFVTDAACASAMAAMDSAIDGLRFGHYDAVLTGGMDANMSPTTFVKFSKIGALSGTGSRPYADGADGFVMGEGGAIFLLKRLADAERDGDRIYALILGIGASSDGRGKGITAPNPAGQKLAVRRGWENGGVVPQPGDVIEGHGTSTRVGDVVEVESLTLGLESAGLPPHSVALGSVKSNFGHLKGAAGAVGVLKMALSLHEKQIPPSLNWERPNPGIDFERSPFYVNTSLQPWEKRGGDGVRRAGASAFGFGGTNFHVVLEEYIPGRRNGRTTVAQAGMQTTARGEVSGVAAAPGGSASQATLAEPKKPLRGALVVGGADEAEIARRLRTVRDEAAAGRAPAPAAPLESELRAPARLAIDYGDAAELAERASLALTVLEAPEASRAARWKAARARGIYFGRGAAQKVAFLYTGQGSQYVNMMAALRALEPIVDHAFAEADRVMQPILGAPLTQFVYVDGDDAEAVARAEEQLKQTEITQPAVLAADAALTALMQAYGVTADAVMGHSLGEYGALVAAGAMPFDDALKAVSARGQAMAEVSFEDNGIMAAVFGPTTQVQEILDRVDGDVVIANINSRKECVIGGSTAAVQRAAAAMEEAGLTVRFLPVSHAFHTHIVSPASEPLATTLRTLEVRAPSVPIVANLTGEFYPANASKEQVIDILAQQVGSPVQFVKGLETLYDAGMRVFVEAGPKRALAGFADEVLGERPDVVALFCNHPKLPDDVAFNQALCGLYAAGHGTARVELPAPVGVTPPAAYAAPASVTATSPLATSPAAGKSAGPAAPASPAQGRGVDYMGLGRLFAEFMDRGLRMYGGAGAPPARLAITGVSLGLPGVERMFDDANLEVVFRGQTLIESIPAELRDEMARKRITRLVKSAEGEAHFETIEDAAEVVKLAGRGHGLDLERDFGFPANRLEALDRVTRIAIAAGIDALRDAGIPLVLRYRTTTKGTTLPDRWMLPEALRDDTGVIFGSAFPGTDSFAQIVGGFYEDQQRRARVAELEALTAEARANGESAVAVRLEARLAEARAEVEAKAYRFDRRFLFRVLSMGHSQFAEYIGARGPNTQINSACATGSAAVAMATDWIRQGRCKRVIVVTADDVTSDAAIPWFGSGFVASGAAAIDERVEDAALPFDRRRHGLLMGMGGAALVIETVDDAAERGLQPICEILGTAIANSAFHGSRLDVHHISDVMEGLIAGAEADWGLNRAALARELVFVSHETYTPARGGSASAEVMALRRVFGADADRIVVANTKGYTGHPMAVAMEEVLAARMLETGLVPPVANFREVDPELGMLNLSRGGSYPVRYALRLGAGFGSQISMSLLQWLPPANGQRTTLRALGYGYRIVDPAAWNAWLRRISGSEQPELEVAGRTLRVRDHAGRTLRVEAPAVPVPPVPIAAAPTAAPAAARPAAAAPISAGSFAASAAQLFAESPAQAPAPVQPTPAPVADPVRDTVLGIVAEKTGYPPDMLDMDLDLEADLGIDTVKQAETFAAIRAAYGIPAEENVRLRDYPTLAHAVGYVYDRRPDLERPSTATGTSSDSSTSTGPSTTTSTSTSSDSSPVTSTGGAADPVRETVLGIVAEKTGYPPDMLDMDLDLEADLGIDTVKQAETFAAIRAAYGIPAEESVRLRDYPTLAHAVGYVYDRRPDLERPSTATSTSPVSSTSTGASTVPSPVTSTGGASDPVRETVLGIVAEKTGYPPDMLDMDLDLEADLGIDTVKQAETFAAIRAAYGIPAEETVKLRDYPTLAHAVGYVYDRRPDLERPSTATGTSPDSSPATSTGGISDAVRDTVLGIVAEKTGYPPDMLDLDLDLEADLGIDTVKQAETFAAIRAAYGIPAEESIKLRDYPTLKHAIDFVYVHRPDLAEGGAAPAAGSSPAASAAEATSAATSPAASAVAPAVAAFADGAAGVPRRIPVPRLRPALKLCKPTGVELGADSRVLVVADGGKSADALTRKLEKLGATVLRVNDAPPAEELAARVEEWQSQGAIQGVYWLPALDAAAEAETLSPAEWSEALRRRVKLFYATLRALPALSESGHFVVAATRLGGRHGYDAAGAAVPLGGAVTGFAKTVKRERPSLLVKALDFEPRADARTIAARLVEETLADPGAVEVGYAEGARWTVGLELREPGKGEWGELPGLTLGGDTTFLVTGAAGSIVSAIVADLAAASAGTFYLLDLTPEPDPADGDIPRLASDRDGLKRDLAERMKAQGERPTPVLIEKRLAALERSAAALAAIQAVRAAGGTAEYRSVNLLDADAVAGVVREIVDHHGGVDVLLHAAGMESSHLLPDKPPAEFDLVFDVKANGWHNLVAALGAARLGAAVVFSSVAARFGNAGQTDYASANDLLCKLISHMRTTRPQTRGIAIDWTGWEGIGMAARGSIPVLLKQAGLELLPPAEGVGIVRRELTAGGFRGEVVIAKGLGAMLAELDETGGLNVDRVPAGKTPAGPMIGRALGAGVYSGLTVATSLDPTEQPFLSDHQIDETPVLPGVMGLEGMAEAAALLFADRHVTLLEDVRFITPFKFHRSRPRTVELHTRASLDGEAGVVADCRLVGSRLLHGQTEPEVTTHFTARVRLSDSANGKAPPRRKVPAAKRARLDAEAIYRVYFHGPAYRVLDSAWRSGDHVVGRFADALPPNHVPADRPLLLAPRLVELAFQTAGLVELAGPGTMGLPSRIERLELLAPVTEADGPFHAVAAARADGAYDVDVIDGAGHVCLALRGYATAALPGPVDPDLLQPLRDV